MDKGGLPKAVLVNAKRLRFLLIQMTRLGRLRQWDQARLQTILRAVATQVSRDPARQPPRKAAARSRERPPRMDYYALATYGRLFAIPEGNIHTYTGTYSNEDTATSFERLKDRTKPRLAITTWQIDAITLALKKLGLPVPAPPPVGEDVGRAEAVLNAALDTVAQAIAEGAVDEDEPPATEDYGIAAAFVQTFDAFLTQYRSTDQSRVPFGGRGAQFEALTNWLDDPAAAPRLLLTAEAGRGKTALILNWIRLLQNRSKDERWQIAFMPISIYAETHRPRRFLEGLANRILEICGEPGLALSTLDEAALKDKVRSQIALLATSGAQVLIVIDGVDELLFGDFDATIFPTDLGKVRVLLAARTQLGDLNSTDWQRRLQWHRFHVHHVTLPPLAESAIREVFSNLGASFDDVAQDSDLPRALATLTHGEPLLLRWYVDDVQEAKAAGFPNLNLDPGRMMAGFGGYYATWMQHQERLWKAEKLAVDPKQIEELLSLFAFTYGPLGSRDLVSLLRYVHGRDILSDVLHLLPLRRFIVGNGEDGHGFHFSHPMIGEYLRQKLFAGSAERISQQVLAWALHELGQLVSGTCVPEGASAYIFSYVRTHLEAADASAAEWMYLAQPGWMRLLSRRGPEGRIQFSEDVRAVENALAKMNFKETIGERWRCALLDAAARYSNTVAPAALLLAAVRHGLMTARAAADICPTEPDRPRSDRLMLLLNLVELDHSFVKEARRTIAIEFDDARHVEMETLKTIRAASILDDETFIEAIPRILATRPSLVPESKKQSPSEVAAKIKKLEHSDYFSRADDLSDIVTYLDERHINKILDVVPCFPHSQKEKIISVLSGRLNTAQTLRAFEILRRGVGDLSIDRALRHIEIDRFEPHQDQLEETLMQIAARLRAENQYEISSLDIEGWIFFCECHPEINTSSLNGLAIYCLLRAMCTDRDIDTTIRKFLQSLFLISSHRINSLIRLLVKAVPASLTHRLIAAARSNINPRLNPLVLAVISEHLPSADRCKLFQEAVGALGEDRLALAYLAEHVPAELSEELLQEVFSILRSLPFMHVMQSAAECIRVSEELGGERVGSWIRGGLVDARYLVGGEPIDFRP